MGEIAEGDVKLAETFQAHIYGFNVSISEKLKQLCKSTEVDYVLTNIIYRLVETLKKDIEKKLPHNDEEEVTGEANVLAVFTITDGKKKIPVAGCRCVKGSLTKSSLFRLVRETEVIYDGKKVYMFLSGNRYCCCRTGFYKLAGELMYILRHFTYYTLHYIPGKLHSMKHLKDEVDTVRSGLECGLSLQDHSVVVKEGDEIVCYKFNKIPQKSEWDPGF